MTGACGRRAIALVLAVAASLAQPVQADHSFAEIARQVNPKLVKVFGAGGFQGIVDYATGVLISPDGYVLTTYSPRLDSRQVRVHLYDGRRLLCELVAAEPQLDVALLRIQDQEQFKQLPLPYFDLTQPPPPVQVGDWVLGISNQFKVASGDEPMSVQRGTIAAITPFAGRRGVTMSPYQGTAYVVDAITNNSGGEGGVLVTRKGELIGLIGKELRNTLTDTWVNYAMPIKDLTDFATRAMRGDYKPIARPEGKKIEDKKAFHGIVLLPDVLASGTPPYVEEILPGSPAAEAGIKVDDLIVFLRVPRNDGSNEIDERVVANGQAFRETLAPLDPGTPIKVVVRRGNQLLSLDLKLGPTVRLK